MSGILNRTSVKEMWTKFVWVVRLADLSRQFKWKYS